MKKNRRLILMALMISQALVLSVAESWIPIPVAVPGVKLGLANIITIIAIIYFTTSEDFMIVLLRTILASFFTGGPVILLFSMTGGILSMLVMALLYRKFSKLFSLVGISIAGSVVHNGAQLLMAGLVMRSAAVMGYLPVLLVSGIITGCFTGLCSGFLKRAFDRAGLFNIN